MKLDATVAHNVFSAAGIAEVEIEDVPKLGLVCRVERARVHDALQALRDSDHAFTFMVDLFGVDTEHGIDVVYHLRSLSRDEDVRVKAAHGYGDDLASVWDLFPVAAYAERECAEMFGMTLSGNPNPKHLLLTDESEPLLLKSVQIRGPEEVRDR